jgi:oligopeptide transport system permease protein
MASDTAPTGRRSARPESRHVVADFSGSLAEVDAVDTTVTPRSMWGEAWHNLVRNPVFIISALLILFVLFVAAFPSVFTDQDPTYGDVTRSREAPSPEHPFGTTAQGYDVLSRTLYGTRTSVAVGFFTMLLSTAIGSVIGAVSGFVGGWLDAVLSRITDVAFAIPLILGAIVIGMRFDHVGIGVVVVVLSLFGWTNIARIMRGTVISVKNEEFITASTALGAGRMSNLLRHVVPNAIAPVIVTATVNLGVFIVSEATLSYLGVGITSSVSWGADIDAAQAALRTQPMMLFYPSVALAVTVLSFIMLGDAVRDALDPKARKR